MKSRPELTALNIYVNIYVREQHTLDADRIQQLFDCHDADGSGAYSWRIRKPRRRKEREGITRRIQFDSFAPNFAIFASLRFPAQKPRRCVTPDADSELHESLMKTAQFALGEREGNYTPAWKVATLRVANENGRAVSIPAAPT
jgi:hypothetical protein